MTTTDRTPLAQAIIARRDAIGISQKELADRAGVSVGYVGLIELGERVPSPDKLVQIVAALEMSEKEGQRIMRMLPTRPLTVSERLTRLEEAVAALAERIQGDG